MRTMGVAAGAAATAIAVIGSLTTATSAQATDYGVALNGPYRAFSNGEWAQTSAGPNGAGGAMVFIDQPSKMETWTLTSGCISPIQCTGEVRSDAGGPFAEVQRRFLAGRPRHPELGAVPRRHRGHRPPEVRVVGIRSDHQ